MLLWVLMQRWKSQCQQDTPTLGSMTALKKQCTHATSPSTAPMLHACTMLPASCMCCASAEVEVAGCVGWGSLLFQPVRRLRPDTWKFRPAKATEWVQSQPGQMSETWSVGAASVPSTTNYRIFMISKLLLQLLYKQQLTLMEHLLKLRLVL